MCLFFGFNPGEVVSGVGEVVGDGFVGVVFFTQILLEIFEQGGN